MDLSDQSIGILAGAVDVMKDTANTAQGFVDQAKTVADGLTAASATLMEAVRAAAMSSQSIFVTIQAGQEESKAAAEEWAAASKSFAEAAGPLAEDVRALLAELSAFPSEARKQAQAMAADLEAQAKDSVARLTDHARTIGNRLDISATRFADQMDRFATSLRSRIAAHDGIQKAITEHLDELHQQRGNMAAQLDRLHGDSTAIRRGTLQAVKTLAESDQQRTRELQDAMRAVAAQLRSLQDRQELTNRLLIGEGGSPEDLLGVLGTLRDKLGSFSMRAHSTADAG